MGNFNFNIETSANFNYGTARSTRALLKTTEAKPRWKTSSQDSLALAAELNRRMAAQNRTPHAIRHQGTRPATVNRGAVQENTFMYRNFKISTACSGPSAWVASFGRLDGRPVFGEGTTRSTLKTAAYLSQALAIADAQISIDELSAAKPAAR